jgi:hypothetical protein
MKNTLLLFSTIALILLSLSSCKKEHCNCGEIVNDGVDGNCYYLDIKNSCSDNTQRFCFDFNTWFDANVGEQFCVENVSSW